MKGKEINCTVREYRYYTIGNSYLPKLFGHKKNNNNRR